MTGLWARGGLACPSCSSCSWPAPYPVSSLPLGGESHGKRGHRKGTEPGVSPTRSMDASKPRPAICHPLGDTGILDPSGAPMQVWHSLGWVIRRQRAHRSIKLVPTTIPCHNGVHGLDVGCCCIRPAWLVPPVGQSHHRLPHLNQQPKREV